MNKNKKEEQIMTNEAAVNLFDIAVSTITANSPWMNLDYCNAEMIFTDDYVILKSYETLIACYNKRLSIFCDVLRNEYTTTNKNGDIVHYSRTSIKQINRFIKKMIERYKLENYYLWSYREVK